MLKDHMPTFSNATIRKYSNWIPLFLIVFPTLMALIPLVVEVPPRRALYYTPALAVIFNILVISFAIATGALDRLRSISVKWLPGVFGAALLIIAGYSTISAVSPRYSALKLFDLLLFLGLSYFGAYIFEQGGRRLIRFVLIAIFGSVILAIPLVAILFLLRTPDYFIWPNFIPGFIHVRIYGFSLTLSIAVGIGLLTLPTLQKSGAKALIVAGLVLLWTTLFWTSSRGGIYALILVFPVLALLFAELRKALMPGILSIIVGAAISSQLSVPNESFGFINSFIGFIDSSSVNDFSANRLWEWSVILDFIAEKPFFGHGYGQAIFVDPAAGVVHAHVHNIVLEAAFSWGWVGAIFAGFLVLGSWFAGLKKTLTGDVPERLCAFILVSVFLAYAWVDGIYYYYQGLIPLGLCVGILASNPKRD